MAMAKVISAEMGEMAEKSGFLFPESVLEKVLNGNRSICMCCGQSKDNPNHFIRPECFKAAEEEEEGSGAAKAEAARLLYEDRGGKVEFIETQRPKRIDEELFEQMKTVAIGHLVGNPGASLDQVMAVVQGNFAAKVQDTDVIRTAAKTAQTVYLNKMNWKKSIEQAEAAVDIWYEDHPDDLRGKYEVAQDIMAEHKEEEFNRKALEQAVYQIQGEIYGSLCEETVEDFFQQNHDCVEHPNDLVKVINSRREKTGEPTFPPRMLEAILYTQQKPVIERLCHEVARVHFKEDPKDLQHPGAIAKYINELRAEEGELPLQEKILTAILGEHQEKVKAMAWDEGEAERRRLIADAQSFMKFDEDPNRRKGPRKPGSAARRGKIHSHHEKGGGKIRGKKGKGSARR